MEVTIVNPALLGAEFMLTFGATRLRKKCANIKT